MISFRLRPFNSEMVYDHQRSLVESSENFPGLSQCLFDGFNALCMFNELISKRCLVGGYNPVTNPDCYQPSGYPERVCQPYFHPRRLNSGSGPELMEAAITLIRGDNIAVIAGGG